MAEKEENSSFTEQRFKLKQKHHKMDTNKALLKRSGKAMTMANKTSFTPYIAHIDIHIIRRENIGSAH